MVAAQTAINLYKKIAMPPTGLTSKLEAIIIMQNNLMVAFWKWGGETMKVDSSIFL